MCFLQDASIMRGLHCFTLMIMVAEKKVFFFLLSMPEPNFVSMAHMSESVMSASGDDDKVYLFFSETAVECDCYNKLLVSRVARVCKVRNRSLFVAATFPETTITYKHNFLSCAHSAISSA